jgi:hypothetical protein
MRKASLFVLLVVAVGCTKLNSQSDVQVKPGDMKYCFVDPISKSQKINVSAKASDGKFNVYCFLDKDKAEVEKDLDQNKVGAKMLAHKLKTDAADLDGIPIPANEKAVILLTSTEAKIVDVRLKITN